MLSNEEGIGKINTSDYEKQNLAELSRKFKCDECGYFLDKYVDFEKESLDERGKKKKVIKDVFIDKNKKRELNKEDFIDENKKNHFVRGKNVNTNFALNRKIKDRKIIEEKNENLGHSIIKEKKRIEENFELIKILKKQKKKKKKKYNLYEFKNINEIKKEILEYAIISERIDIQTQSNKKKMENVKIFLKKIKLLDIFDFLINIFKMFFIFYVVYRVLEIQYNFSHFDYN